MPGRAIRKDQRGNKHRPSVWSLLDTEGERRRKGKVVDVVKGWEGGFSLQFQRVESNIYQQTARVSVSQD